MSLSGPSGGSHDEDEAGAFVDINITPLTDVILVLLIIFMVTSTAVVEHEKQKAKGEAEEKAAAELRAKEEEAAREKARLEAMQQATGSIRVNLPQGAGDGSGAPSADVRVRIGESGAFEVDGRAMPDAAVRPRLEELAKERPGARLVVEADVKAAHGRVVWLMETAKLVGFAQLGIATHERGELPPVP
jgi:biopolymer transport protein ExbD